MCIVASSCLAWPCHLDREAMHQSTMHCGTVAHALSLSRLYRYPSEASVSSRAAVFGTSCSFFGEVDAHGVIATQENGLSKKPLSSRA
jgi:hypothetical protein